ncbi:hypothetical protein WN48_07631 [Eufriesea mexicana]|uniref:Uncharacterized protein n=1 Tax=Eufriesea mexicana TaxID=516756 RepID=A0A310SV36_9HYME|nr:hypothetical protein WN48_07631 [Eufriesea mexicana]
MMERGEESVIGRACERDREEWRERLTRSEREDTTTLATRPAALCRLQLFRKSVSIVQALTASFGFFREFTR